MYSMIRHPNQRPSPTKERTLPTRARRMKRLIGWMAVGALALSACATPESESSEVVVSATSPIEVQRILSDLNLQGKAATEVIDALDRLPLDNRPTDLMASVGSTDLTLTAGDTQVVMPLPHERFYLSVAPYLDRTHECFLHSLTTCTGELAEVTVQVKITDNTNGEVLIDQEAATFANGFLGFWLPADIDGTVSMRMGDKSGSVDFRTDEGAPTCLTTLQLT